MFPCVLRRNHALFFFFNNLPVQAYPIRIFFLFFLASRGLNFPFRSRLQKNDFVRCHFRFVGHKARCGSAIFVWCNDGRQRSLVKSWSLSAYPRHNWQSWGDRKKISVRCPIAFPICDSSDRMLLGLNTKLSFSILEKKLFLH